MKYLGCLYRAYMKTTKNGGFCEELLNENGIEAVLATFYCYECGVTASEAVQKMATDQKDYQKCSSCVYNLLNRQNISITVRKGWLLGHLLNIAKKNCKNCTEKGAKTGPWRVCYLV